MSIAATAPAGLAVPPVNPMLTSPIMSTLVRLSIPNMVAMLAMSVVAIAETVYVGSLGTPALAGLALVFPMVMLQSMMSAGAMGGGVSSAVARALGAGNVQRANALAWHALVIGVVAGVLFTAVFLGLGKIIYSILGGSGPALAEAMAYSNVVFLGAAGIWTMNMLASVIRGSGNMVIPSALLFSASAGQVLIGGGLGLGIGPLPRLGMAGIALGQVVASAIGTIVLLFYLGSGRARVRLSPSSTPLQWSIFREILSVGAVACISPLQTVLTVLILTRLVSSFGTEALAGYGIGARLEFLLIPVGFAIGVACIPLVGMAIGAGNVERARRVAWTGALLAACTIGAVGLLVTINPDIWSRQFTQDPNVLSAANTYFKWAGLSYPLFGAGLCLFFASQGAGKVLGPVLAGTLRLLVVAIGGWWLATIGAPAWSVFALIGFALALNGLAVGLAVYLVPWGPKKA